jgi:hypothetical protein
MPLNISSRVALRCCPGLEVSPSVVVLFRPCRNRGPILWWLPTLVQPPLAASSGSEMACLESRQWWQMELLLPSWTDAIGMHPCYK